MSISSLQLHIAGDISVEQISEFLTLQEVSKDSGEFVTGFAAGTKHVGPIEIVFLAPRESWNVLNLGNKIPWNIAIEFHTPHVFDSFQTALAMYLSEFFHKEKGGYFFAARGTGSPMFFFGDNGLVLPDSEREQYCKYPLPTERVSYGDLPIP